LDEGSLESTLAMVKPSPAPPPTRIGGRPTGNRLAVARIYGSNELPHFCF
jgi:hypothetical protein